MCLGAEFSTTTNVAGQECWPMSSYKYCNSAVTNLGSVLKNCGLRLQKTFVIPPSCSYRT